VLILETLRDARDLWAHTRRAGRVSVRVAAQVGTTLGRLHRTSRDPGEPADSIGTLEPPSVFDLTAPAIERYAEMSAANVRLVRLLQSDPAFAPLMSILAATWRPDALIHNDMKWENVLVAGPRVQLVDFEMAGVGDPAWDVGAALASYVVAWVRSIPATDDPEATSADLAAASPFPIERSWPALRALWTAYGTANGGTAPSAGRTLLERSVSFSGARLIQAAHDLSAESWNLDPRMARLAQVGMNVLRDPARAARALMGLAFDGT
jgi:aminoglycoside phosphotransferase (APT) family kinase protein